jgi:hypothetical protein
MKRIGFIVIAMAAVAPIISTGQSGLRKQLTDSSAPQPMSATELAELTDPMFLLVLKDRSDEVRLEEIERLIVGQNGKRNLFVVDERLQSSTQGESRRAVIAFTGSNQGQRLDPNVALSVNFNHQAFSPGFVEAWGWDDSRSRYNYYKLDGNPPSWKFRGNSDGADRLPDSQRAGTCLACHINGAPLMKELPFPWNNWQSFRNEAPYLSANASGRWPIAESPRFKDLKGAELLETSLILPSIRQFNGRRVSAAVQTASASQNEVLDGPRLLKPLFQTTEYNIISAGQFSGLHPLPKAGAGPPETITVPDTFFLNANVLAGGGIPQYEGLGVPEAREFATLLKIQPAEYRALVNEHKTRIGGQSGDANFAWFVPEPSHVDNQMVDILIQRGVITREFAAAALAVDLEAPVFSATRARLLAAIPQRFRFRPRAPGDVAASHPDQLTEAVVASLKSANPAAGTPEADFLTLLQNLDPISELRRRTTSYATRTKGRLSNAQQRKVELARLYKLMLQRRKDAERAIPALVESPWLFPGS